VDLNKSSPIVFALVCFSVFCGFFSTLSVNAASVLAAWVLRSDGVLQLRTSKDARLEAFFQVGSNGKGNRVWIDFPGELSRPRSIRGNGPVREIRLGKPFKGYTRLVVEFIPSYYLDPSRLKLIGTSPGRWELNFPGLSTNGLRKIGEGDVRRSYNKPVFRNYSRRSSLKLDSSNLPSVPRGLYRVVIDPGHGGPDPGAVGIGGLRETDIVLDVSKRVSKFLTSKGVKVLMTRKKEMDLDLPPRVVKANNFRANAFVSIHANASRGNRKDVNGLETYYYTGFRGLTLAKSIHSQIIKVAHGSPDRGVRRSRFFVIRRTNMPAALVEIGFVTGRIDSRKLRQGDHRERLAFAIAKGILNYLKEAG